MKLFEITDIFLGVLKSRELSESKTNYIYSLIDYSCVENNKINVDYLKTVFANNKLDKNLLLQKNDILLKLFPPIGLIYVDNQLDKTIVSSNFAVIRSKKEIDSKILFFLLKQNLHQFILNGTIIKTLKISEIKNININYDESKKIKLLSKLDFKFQKQIELLDRKKELILSKAKFYGGKNGK